MARFFHVTSILNRDSIKAHGLDWKHMGAAPGIAGSSGPEVDGCFLATYAAEAGWFVWLNNTGGPVDVWGVDGVDDDELVASQNGHHYLHRAVPADQLTLLRCDLQVDPTGHGPPGVDLGLEDQVDR